MFQLALLSVLFAVALGGSCTPTSVLVGYSINDGNGFTSVINSVNGATNMALSGTALTSNTVGKVSGGLDLGATGSGKITLTTTVLNNFGAANCWQMSLWVKLTAAAADGTFIKNWGTSTGLFAWGLDSGGTKQTFNWAGTTTVTAPSAFSLNTYYHVAASSEHGVLKLWQDGVVVATSTSTISTATTTIGCLGVGAKLSDDCSSVLGEYLASAVMDDVSLWTDFYDPQCFYNSAVNAVPYGFYNAVNCNLAGSRCPQPNCASVSPSPASPSATSTPTPSPSVSVTPSRSVSSSPAGQSTLNAITSLVVGYTQEQKLILGLGVGFVVGIVALIMLIICCVYMHKRRRNQRERENNRGKAPQSASGASADASDLEVSVEAS